MKNIISFQEAIENPGKKYLLLGNGFSIACEPNIFTYSSLYNKAMNKKCTKQQRVEKVFNLFETKNFEVIIKHLEDMKKLTSIYIEKNNECLTQINNDIDFIKKSLISTISDIHPSSSTLISEDSFSSCRKFLSYFLNDSNQGHIYTLNYDLLLYWALLQDKESGNTLNFDDGFRRKAHEKLVWYGNETQSIFYLHGALHLEDKGSYIIKHEWESTKICLMDQITDNINDNMFPLFVSEGTDNQKEENIFHNSYLQDSYRNFSRVMSEKDSLLYIYGYSFSNNDNHILKKIKEGQISTLFISLHGDPTNEHNKEIIKNIKPLEEQRRNPDFPLEVFFYDAESAKVWS